MNNQSNDIKKAIEEIHIPLDKLNKTIELGVKRGQANLTKPKRKLYPLLGIASVTTFLLIGSAFVSPVMANVLSDIPVFKSVFEFAGDNGLEIASKKGLSQKVAQSDTDKDIKLTIQDVFYDGTRLSIGYTQESSRTVQELGELDLRVNGKKINFADSRSGDFVSDNHYAGVINISPTEELPDSFELTIGINNIGKETGAWDFKIPVEKSIEQVKTIRPEKTLVYKDTKLTLKSIKVGPAGVKLSVAVSSPIGKDPLNIDGSLLKINLLNSEGMALTQLDGSGSGEEKDNRSVMEMEYRFAPLEKTTSHLTVSPFLMPIPKEMPSEISAPLERNQLPITLDQGEMGDIVVTDIKFQKDKTLLYFNVNSDFAYDGNMNFNRIWIEDTAGTDLTLKTKGYPERIKQDSYVQEFNPVGKNIPLKVLTNKISKLEILKDLEMKIPIQ